MVITTSPVVCSLGTCSLLTMMIPGTLFTTRPSTRKDRKTLTINHERSQSLARQLYSQRQGRTIMLRRWCHWFEATAMVLLFLLAGCSNAGNSSGVAQIGPLE